MNLIGRVILLASVLFGLASVWIGIDVFVFRGRMTPFLLSSCAGMDEREARAMAQKLVSEKDFSERGFRREDLLNGQVVAIQSPDGGWDVSYTVATGRRHRLALTIYPDCDVQYLGSG